MNQSLYPIIVHCQHPIKCYVKSARKGIRDFQPHPGFPSLPSEGRCESDSVTGSGASSTFQREIKGRQVSPIAARRRPDLRGRLPRRWAWLNKLRRRINERWKSGNQCGMRTQVMVMNGLSFGAVWRVWEMFNIRGCQTQRHAIIICRAGICRRHLVNSSPEFQHKQLSISTTTYIPQGSLVAFLVASNRVSGLPQKQFLAVFGGIRQHLKLKDNPSGE